MIDEKQLGVGRKVYFGSQCEGTLWLDTHVATHDGWQELEAAGDISSSIRKRREKDAGALFTFTSLFSLGS